MLRKPFTQFMRGAARESERGNAFRGITRFDRTQNCRSQCCCFAATGTGDNLQSPIFALPQSGRRFGLLFIEFEVNRRSHGLTWQGLEILYNLFCNIHFGGAFDTFEPR